MGVLCGFLWLRAVFCPHPNPLPRGEGIVRCGLAGRILNLPHAQSVPSPACGRRLGLGTARTLPKKKRPQILTCGRSLKKSKLTDKPGSVVDSHSSRPAIAHWLKQPTRVQYGPYHVNPYLALLRVEFTVPRTVTSRAVRSYRTLSPLPDPITGPSAVCSLLHWS